MNFKHAIVRPPCRNFVKGLTTANLGKPEIDLALEQHGAYNEALKQCGVEIIQLKPEEEYPDSCFVEDTCILTSQFAVITNPGASSRRGEIISVERKVSKIFDHIERIDMPGTLDGGDVLQIQNQFFIGLSSRTNLKGAEQFIEIVNKYEMSGTTIRVDEGLHLKSSISYLGNQTIVGEKKLISLPVFSKYRKLLIDSLEIFAANSLRVNDYVLTPKGFPKTLKMLNNAGFKPIILDVSEFHKLDGGLSCLSLRF